MHCFFSIFKLGTFGYLNAFVVLASEHLSPQLVFDGELLEDLFFHFLHFRLQLGVLFFQPEKFYFNMFKNSINERTFQMSRVLEYQGVIINAKNNIFIFANLTKMKKFTSESPPPPRSSCFRRDFCGFRILFANQPTLGLFLRSRFSGSENF